MRTRAAEFSGVHGGWHAGWWEESGTNWGRSRGQCSPISGVGEAGGPHLEGRICAPGAQAWMSIVGRVQHEGLPREPARMPASMPVWRAPPVARFCGILPLQQIVVHTANTIVVLNEIRAYAEGALLDITAVTRRPPQASAIWNNPQEHRTLMIRRPSPDAPIPDELLRFRVVYSDGRTASTIDSTRPYQVTLPAAPRLTNTGGVGQSGNAQQIEWRMPLWLWPAPPPEEFDLFVSWPAYGIAEDTATRLDGARIAAAAISSDVPYWP